MRIEIMLKKFCPNCNANKAVFLTETGELICSRCGLVLNTTSISVDELEYAKYGGNPYGEALQSGMRLTYRRICPQCKNVFETQKSNKRFCSEACRKTFWILNRHSPKYEAELARKKREKTTRAFKKE